MSSFAAGSGGVASEPRHLRELGLPALLGAAVLFFSAMLLLSVNISAMRANMVWIKHTQQVLHQLSALEAALGGEELTVRSYALTGDPRFLQYQQQERGRALKAVAELGRLAEAEAPHAERARRLREAVTRHTALLDSLSGAPARAVAAAILDSGKRAVVKAPRLELAAFRADEVHTLAGRQDKLTGQLSHAFMLAVGIIVAAFLLGGLGLMASQFRLPASGSSGKGQRKQTRIAPEGMLREYRHGILHELGLPALFGACVMLLSATLLLGVNIEAMRDNLAWIARTQQILLAVADAETGVVGDQLTLRGYALTGDARFLLYQKVERDKLQRAMARLAQLAAPDPGGAERIETIRNLMRRHMDNYGGVSGLGPAHADAVAKAIDDDKKRVIMFKARGALAAFRSDEVRALGERQDHLTRQLGQSFLLAVGIIVAAFLLGGLGLIASQLRLPSLRAAAARTG